eukprot:6519031-Lingulodinium_polyedra.AAC.1
MGKDETGAWRTACLKEYPPRVCRAIAGVFRDGMLHADAARAGGDEARRAVAAGLVMPLRTGE